MDKKKITAIIATSTVAMNVTAAKTVLADTNNNNSISAVEDIKDHQAKTIMPTLNGITINKQLINRNYSKGVIIVPKYIVIHDTDNRRVGANAMANRNYFANHADAKASAHYTVDQANIIQCLEDNWRGWHVGDGNNPLINNSNTIGIELCVNADNDFNKTLENGIALTKYLMQKYNIPAERVVRHYDVSRKICPKMMIQDNPGLWTYFKNVISGGSSSAGSVSDEKILYTGKVVNVSSTLNVRESANGSSAVVGSLKKDSIVNIYGEENGWYKVAYSSYGETKFGYASKNYITVNSSSSNNGTSSGGSNNSTSGSNNTTTSVKKGKVVNVSTSLNVRNSASSNGSVISYLKNGQEVTVNYEENGWYNITFDTKKTGFVSKNYISITSSSGSNTSGSISSGSNSSSGSSGSTNSGSTNSGSSSNNTTTSAKKGKVVNISTSLNVRSSASTSGSVVAQLKNGQEVTVNYEQNGWYNITFNTNKTGFVSKSYISIIRSTGSATGGSTSSGSGSSANNNGSNSNNTNNNSATSSVKKGKVVNVSTNLNVRKGAGTNYSVVAYVTNNTEVTILSEQGSWYKIRLKDGKEGYAAKQYINIIPSTNSGATSSSSSVSKESKGKVVNVSTNLNVRKGAGTSYSVVAYLLPGSEVTIKNTTNGWYYIEAKVNGSIKDGYVKTDYIQIIK